MKIIVPTVGPIVGQADKHYLRIMARGKESRGVQSIVCILKEGSKIAKRGAQFRVVKTNPTYDMTGG